MTSKHNTTPTATPLPVYERAERPSTLQAVMAQWTHNLGGGLGAAAMWLCVSYAAHGGVYFISETLGIGVRMDPWPNPLRVGMASAAVGVFVFGALMWWRSSLDEAIAEGAFQELEAEVEVLEEMLAEKDAEWKAKYDILLREHNQLRADHRITLGRQATPGRAVMRDEYEQQAIALPARDTLVLPVKDAALSDARELMRRAYTRQPWSRDHMMDKKKMGAGAWNKKRWEDAREHLLSARVLSYPDPNGKVPQWTYPDDLDTALLQLEGKKIDHSRVMSS
jgi:hypothetical protein